MVQPLDLVNFPVLNQIKPQQNTVCSSLWTWPLALAVVCHKPSPCSGKFPRVESANVLAEYQLLDLVSFPALSQPAEYTPEAW